MGTAVNMRAEGYYLSEAERHEDHAKGHLEKAKMFRGIVAHMRREEEDNGTTKIPKDSTLGS
jgi:hypothetical protein